MVAIALLGLLLTAAAVAVSVGHGRARAADAQRDALERAVLRTRQALSRPVAELQALTPLYAEAGRDLKPGQTRYALQRLLTRPVVTSAAVVDLVADEDRRKVERRVGGPITEPTGSGRVRDAPARALYAVVVDSVFRAGPRPYTPMNLLGDQARSEAIIRAASTGRPAITAPMVAPLDPNQQVQIYVPVIDRKGAFTGRLVVAGQNSARLLGDVGAPAQISDGRQPLGASGAVLDAPISRRIDVLGRPWTVRAGAVPTSRTVPLVVALCGLLLTLGCLTSTRILMRRSDRAEAMLARSDSARVRATREVAQERRHARFLADNSTDMLCLSGPDGRWLYVSPASRSLLGYEPEELVGVAPATLCHPDDRAALLEAVAAASPAADALTLRLRRRNGDHRWVELLTHATVESDGTVSGLQSSYRDVAARRSSEQAVRAAEARFRQLFAAAPLGIGVLDLDSTVLQANAALAALTGRTTDSLERRPLDELLHPADADDHRRAREALLAGEIGTHKGELRVTKLDEEIAWCEVHTVLLLDQAGEPEHLLVQALDVSGRRRYERQLQHLADHDSLTGLRNRRTFELAVSEHLSRAERYGARGALLMVDLDHFKVVNDTLGHAAGDRLLVASAHSLGERLRDSDILARLGGDEFAVLLPSGGREEAEAAGRALLEAISSQQSTTAQGSRRPVTASVGIALADEPHLTAEELMIRADLALYDAKERGRDQLCIHSADPGSDRLLMGQRITWADRIRDALATDSLELYAQPIRSLTGEGTFHHELLIRMRSDAGELILPAAFLDVAERFGLVGQLDRWVVHEAIELLADARDRGHTLVLDVNVSGRSIDDPELLASIRDGLQRTGIDPSGLVFEVTETAAVANIPRAQHFAEQLGRLGCRFALDDFGAGFGSFYYLKHLPFDFVKLDGEFVRGCADTEMDQLIIGAVVEIAKGLGKQTVAEGAEDQRTVDYLRRAGVDHVQGFHVGRPVPVGQLLGGTPESTSHAA